MQVKLFLISILDDGSALTEMNTFLRGHKILDMTQHFFSTENGASWAYSIRYLEGDTPANVAAFASAPFGRGREKIDYMYTLDSDTFAIFAKMREARKQIAQHDAIPPYTIFTDAELASLAQLPDLNLASMQTIKGVGEKKVSRFGERFLALYQKKT